MINLQDFIENANLVKKFVVDDLLFVEFKCPADSKDSIWWHNNFFAYVLVGETMLQTPKGKYFLRAGDCAFAKKGSVISHGELHEEFCELLVFVPDDFIRSVIQKYSIPLGPPVTGEKSDTIIPLSNDDLLTTYFQSLFTYFNLPKPPPETLLKIKFEELVVSILSSNNYAPLRYYFSEICASSKPSIKAIMEANFSQNLSLDEFARLCVRSLSAFKLEFKSIYHTTPGKWLQEKRLEYSRFLLEMTNKSIEEICFESGFENRSHFIRVFKSKYGITPGKFSLQSKLCTQ